MRVLLIEDDSATAQSIAQTGGLLSERCGVENVEWIALGSTERVVIAKAS